MMSWPRCRLLLSATAVWTALVSAAAPCQAGLFDWLVGRRPPATVVYQPVVGCCQNRTVVNYAPHTVYTTSWVRVPVTTYQPVATVDPVTCCRVNYMQPSTTYTWQARRQAHVVYRPFLSRVANACASCGAGAPATAAPASIGPLVTAPGPAPAVAPSTMAPGAAPTPAPFNAAPADLIPRLDPSGVPGISVQRPVITSPYPTSPYGAVPAPTTVYPNAPTPAAPEAAYPSPTAAPPYIDPPAVAPADAFESQRLLSPPIIPVAPEEEEDREPSKEDGESESQNEASSPLRFDTRPILDPEPDLPVTLPRSVPRLLNPTDRSAALQPRRVVPVSWPAPSAKPAVYRRPAAIQQPTPTPRLPRPAPPLNDRGWSSAY